MRPEFDTLYATHAPYVLNVTRRIVGADDAADVAQETWLKVSRGLDRFREDAQPRSWLTSIARNAALDHLRRRARRVPAVDLGELLALPASSALDPHGVYLRRERDARLAGALASLPPRLRAAALACLSGLSCQEAATVLGVPLGTVKSRLFRARVSLQATVAEGGIQ